MSNAAVLEDMSPSKQHVSALARNIVFTLFAALIVVGPAPGQLFDSGSVWLREWVMFSGVGAGIPDGRFIVLHEDGSETEFTPLEAAGLERYPLVLHHTYEGRISTLAEFASYAAPLCATVPENSVVRFDGSLGTAQGWFPVQVENVCIDEGEES